MDAVPARLPASAPTAPPGAQFLKWIGNKHRFAAEIAATFPKHFGTYFEPFLGSGAVLAHLGPERAVASDACAPLIALWKRLQDDPDALIEGYRVRWHRWDRDRRDAYFAIRDRFNESPNPDDFLFLLRAGYGGVVRFRKRDGHLNTPPGPHRPIVPEKLAARVRSWSTRIAGTTFLHGDFEEAFAQAKAGDLIYCDPPYVHSYAELYGAQAFSFPRLVRAIEGARDRGVFVALSIDGWKKSGRERLELPIPDDLFCRIRFISRGRDQLRRLQMAGETLEDEVVSDRLMLTW